MAIEAMAQPLAPAGGAAATAAPNAAAAAVRVEHLSFSYPLSAEPTVRDLSLELPPGSRCLLIGANGAGACVAGCFATRGGARAPLARDPLTRRARALRPPQHAPRKKKKKKKKNTKTGKTTLLQLLGGKYMIGRKDVTILGGAPFFDMVSSAL
jgi:hypothetical protein